VVELGVHSGADFVTDGWFQINENGTWNVLSGGGFAEKGVERIVTRGALSFLDGHIAIGADAMFQAVEFPAVITELDTGLTEMD